MNSIIIYGIIFLILLVLELVYFRIADRFNIIDKPNERSSHSTIVLRGGGIIFMIGMWVWAISQMMNGPSTDSGQVPALMINDCYPFFLMALTLVAGVSFIDDIKSLPDSVRLVAQFAAMGLMFYELGMFTEDMWWMILPALIVCVGASNIINFMDGINGITGAYTLAVLVPLALLNSGSTQITQRCQTPLCNFEGIIDQSFLIVAILSVMVFCLFNFRPRGKAKCFAGDVGSLGAAFIMLFVIGRIVMRTASTGSGQAPDPTWLVFLAVYGIDGVMTICHRIMLHENLGQAHRKHSYQLMANELGMSHITVSLIYAGLQLGINLAFVYVCPNTVLAHWLYFAGVLVLLGGLNLCFRKKYYHLHEEYLASLRQKQ